ncbi:MAG: efflux RND transporter periplasmic adaptor subunit [Rikenellaceae bacterium]
MERFKLSLYAIALIVAISCHQKSKKMSMPPLRVEVAEAQSVPIFEKVEVASQIKSLYDVVIQPRVDGFLDSISFSEGMPIKRGDLLFTLDASQYNISVLAAQAELESAIAQEIAAHNNYQRAVPLAEIDAISQSDLDQYTATHSAAKASVKSAQEALNSAKLNLSYTQIASPIDGIIADSPASEGDYVGPSTALSTLTTVSYIDTVEVEIPIPTAIYLKNVAHQEGGSYDNSTLLSDIELTLSGGEKYRYAGEYHYTLKDSPTSSSSVVVVAKFPNPSRRLKSGMFARVKSNIGEQKESVVVPQEAVNQNQGVNSVWIVRPDSVVEFREVTLGATSAQNWIIESGVEPGESVLLTGQLKVHNGAKIIPTKK